MKWTSRLVFGVLLWWGASAGARPAILGVFSNEEGEFKTVTLMVHRSGYAYFHAAVMGTIGEWKYDAKRQELTLTCYDPQANREESLKFAFDAREKAYWIMDPETGLRATDSAGRLRRLSDKIPPELVAAFAAYPENLRRERAEREAHVRARQAHEEKLTREQPEYERLLAELGADPRAGLREEYHGVDTPGGRALRQALGDLTRTFPEDVLIDMLEHLPEQNHWNREQIFARPELTTATIEAFWPRAVEWGTHLNYSIVGNLAQHPNTPLAIVEKLATEPGELPIGAVGVAQDRVVQLAREALVATPPPSAEWFAHIVRVAQAMPKLAYTERGVQLLTELVKHPVFPVELLNGLAEDSRWEIQLAVAAQPYTSGEALARLAKSNLPRVRAAVAQHPNLSAAVLLELAADPAGEVRAHIAQHPATPAEVLVKMQGDAYYDVRANLIRNPNTPLEVLQALANDPNMTIRQAARAELRTRQQPAP